MWKKRNQNFWESDNKLYVCEIINQMPNKRKKQYGAKNNSKKCLY